MSPPLLDPSRCPLCGRENRCGMVAGAKECWCFTAVIPAEVLAMVPPELEGVVCLCADCARGTVPSPCIGVCELDTTSGTCRGCLRSPDEIEAWPGSGEAEKRAVLVRIAKRSRTGTAPHQRPSDDASSTVATG